jgi:hypothetical protein
MRFNSSSAVSKENNRTATLCVLFGNKKKERRLRRSCSKVEGDQPAM